MFSIHDHSHRRLNILTGEWVQVSPHRAKRPWQGQIEKQEVDERPSYDKDCYLCPGNSRAGGHLNPKYTSTFVFQNDFAALQPDVPAGEINHGLLQAKSEKGICKVIVFSPMHHLTIPEMTKEDILGVVNIWISECLEISKDSEIKSIQIFENKGSMMGCSNPHPHGQIWAQESIPVELQKKSIHQLSFWNHSQRGILEDYLKQELELGERILFQNDSMVVLIPFWAVWPFEAMILPKRKMAHITELNLEEKRDLAEVYQHLTIKYDNLFECSFPYSAGIHQAPFDSNVHPEWHWHMSFYPPLLRSADVKKFMVGYEMFANPQRDITPELAAQKLRELPSKHYKQQ